LFALQKAEVLFEYTAEAVDELSLVVGEEIIILQEISGWYRARDLRGNEGLLPGTYGMRDFPWGVDLVLIFWFLVLSLTIDRSIHAQFSLLQ
jgi:SH3 domain